MMNRRVTMAASLVIVALAGAWSIECAVAQAPAGFKRVELQRHDLVTPDHEAVLARGEFAPGAAVPRHSHPGDEVAYILEGEITLEIDGKPPLKLKGGDSFFVPAGQVHQAKNTGTVAAAILSTYVIEKGKPLATPAK